MEQKTVLDMRSSKYCVVGTAWGGSDRYKDECEDCWMYSIRLPQDMSLAPDFFEHFNQMHIADL